ncbi:hypothetical protein HPP92_016738 [Vanilla planifolia]|uniref:Uncharacterized protein n=1 Tax=Vanilla planifolia TaxID=51239 RepID=A0A835QEM7_VANPL|nr:hypothetical protein HPP92_016738 [Vanilla planifolia]
MGNGNGSETLRSTIPLPRTLLFLLLCIAWVPDTAALWINLPSSGTKCVSQEIQPNIVVLADYSLSSGDSSHDNSTISVKVRIPFPCTLYIFKGNEMGGESWSELVVN